MKVLPRVIRLFARPLMWLAIAGLLLVFVHGTSAYGAERWVSLGGIQFQPSEFAKLALLIWGADDRIIPASHGAAAHAALPDSRLTVLPGVGHYPHLEAADDTVDAIEVSGFNNQVTYHTGSPSIDNSGAQDVVRQG